MADEDKRLSYNEVVSLLQRAAVLQEQRGARAFSKDDLLAAAQEMGIEPGLAATLADAHLAKRDDIALVPRPFDTRIELASSPDSLRLRIPPLRFGLTNLAGLGFAAIWFSFVAFWTKGALHASGPFAAFSIPFWLTGTVLLWRFIMPVVQTTELALDRERGTLRVHPLGRTHELRSTELKARLGEHVTERGSNDRPQKTEPALLVEHGTRTFPLLVGRSDQERRWVESELRSWLSQG